MKKIFFVFLFTSVAFSQSKTNLLESKIYEAIDQFVENPNAENLIKLTAFEKNFSASIALSKSQPELLSYVIFKCNQAYYQNQFGQTINAVLSYEKAWQLFQNHKLKNYDITESCLKPLANLYIIIGDYENAENVIKQYYYIANFENNQSNKFASILNLSIVYQYSGKTIEAINLIEKTLNTENLSKSQKGMLFTNLGNNYLAANNNDKAVKCYQSALNFLINTDDNQSLSNAYRNLALLNNDLKLFEKAKEIFLKNKKNTPRLIAKLYYDEAFLCFQNAKFQDAQNSINNVFEILLPNYVNDSLPKKSSLYAETTLIDALDLQAEIDIIQNKSQKVLESYQLAFHIETLFNVLLVYENSKIINQIRNRNRVEKCLEIYCQLYQKEKKISYIESAFQLQELNKSSVLKETLFNKKTQNKTTKLILEQLQNWNTIIIKEQQKQEFANITKINQAIKKQNELMVLLKSNQTGFNQKIDVKFDVQNLYSKLEKDKATLISYFSGSQKFYIFTVQNHQIKVNYFWNNPATISKINAFLDYFSNADKISNNPIYYNNFGFSLYKLLQLPQKSKHKNLIIIPDGILNFLPFEALITEKTTTSNFAKMNYLINDYAIGYANSASFYINNKPFYHSKERVLGIFPIFENSNLELTFSKNELENLKNNFKGTFLEKEDATFQKFKNYSNNYSILHLSTHATSGDIYNPASLKFYDQEILYSEFYNLKTNPDLVVLSACETGLGKHYKAEGAMSISRGFQMAGAQNLLFSLWKVNDFTTSLLMEKIYKNIEKGTSYFDANHLAKIDYLTDESIPNAKKSPYYWAAFVYYGTLETKTSTNYFIWIILVASIITLLLYYKFYKNGRFSNHLNEK